MVESKDVELNADDSKALGALIQNLKFFVLSTDDGVMGFDGDESIMEGVSRGKYHVVQRWCASVCHPDKRGLNPFLAICTFLIDTSTLSEKPKTRAKDLPVRQGLSECSLPHGFSCLSLAGGRRGFGNPGEVLR